MRLETLFEKFELLAEAPGAVGRMRELVLECAVQGGLVRQDPNEAPASGLIRNAVTARKLLVAARVVREETRDLQSFETNDAELPIGWTLAPLSVYVAVIMGQSPPSSTYNESGHGMPFYQGKAQFGRLYPSATDWCTEPLKIGEPGDVVISVRAPVGPTNMLRETSCIGRGLAALRSLGGDQTHLLYTLRALERSIASLGVGSTFVAISKSDLDSLLIPVPPLAEQRRIVAKVDELMALCDQLEAQQREREARHAVLARAALGRFGGAPTRGNLQLLFHGAYDIAPGDLRKAILTLAVQGRLVGQYSEDEPVAMTFSGLQPYNTADGAGSAWPDTWMPCEYRSLTSLVTSGSRGWKEFYSASGSIFIRTQNIKTDKLDLEDVAFVDLPKSAEGMRAQVLSDDILITITGANVTKATRVDGHIPEAYVSQHIALTRPCWSEMSPWLHLCFVSHGSARGALEKLAYGDKPGLNLNNIRDLVLPIPPLSEQRRIVAKVNELMALVDALESQLATARTTGIALLEAVVAELTAA